MMKDFFDMLGLVKMSTDSCMGQNDGSLKAAFRFGGRS